MKLFGLARKHNYRDNAKGWGAGKFAYLKGAANVWMKGVRSTGSDSYVKKLKSPPKGGKKIG